MLPFLGIRCTPPFYGSNSHNVLSYCLSKNQTPLSHLKLDIQKLRHPGKQVAFENLSHDALMIGCLCVSGAFLFKLGGSGEK